MAAATAWSSPARRAASRLRTSVSTARSGSVNQYALPTAFNARVSTASSA